MNHRARCAIVVVASLALGSACRDKPRHPSHTAEVAAVERDAGVTTGPPPVPNRFAPPATWPAITKSEPDDRTADGLPVMRVSPTAAGREGDVTWISDVWSTLQIATDEASDGARIYFAKSGVSSGFSDVLIRDGRIYTNVIPHLLTSQEHPGGCSAARGGAIVISAPVPQSSTAPPAQRAWRLAANGALDSFDVPPTAGASDRCKAWLDADGSFALGLFGIALWNGSGFEIDRDWFGGRTSMTGARGARYCFRSCNQAETAATDHTDASKLATAMRCTPEFLVFDKWLVGECRREGRLGRVTLGGGTPEILDQVPAGKNQFGTRLALTTDGDVVVGLDYGMRRYAVWRTDATTLSPERTLGDDEVLASASPTLLVRGLPPRVPEDAIPATVLGKRIAFGASGSSVASRELRRGLTARQAQVARAEAVLPRKKKLAVAFEAVVDLECGAYVRSPAGWEGEVIEDWVPPTLPPLSPKAVYDPPRCTPLAEVHANPQTPDLLLGKTADGELALAWLPPPLPLPQGSNPRQGPAQQQPVVQHPRPGTGWTMLGAITRIEALPGLPPPGDHVAIDWHSWLAGGAAIVESGGARILVTPLGAVSIPTETKPMAMLQSELGIYGAVGARLLYCDATGCRLLDPKVQGEIVAVVPRTRTLVVLAYADGRIGLYQIPAGGEIVEDHPLAAEIRKVLAARPMP